MGVYKNPKGDGWYYDYYYKGKRYRKLAPNKQLAEIALADVKTKAFKGDYLGIHEERKITFARFAEDFLAQVPEGSSKQQYRFLITPHLVPHFGDSYLSQITPKSVEDYKARRSAKAKPRSVKNELALFKRMMSRAREWGYTTNDPAQGVKPPRLPERNPRFLSQEEARRLLGVTPDDLKAAIALGLFAGLRDAEIRNLCWSDIDLQRGILTVQPKEDWQTKNRKIRRVPLAPALIPYLKAHPRHIRSPYILCNAEGNRLPALKDRLLYIVKRAGLGPDEYGRRVTPHTLRHTFASWLVMAGVDLATVSKLLGHSSIPMTMVYAHLAPDHLKGAVERLSLGDGHQMDTQALGGR